MDEFTSNWLMSIGLSNLIDRFKGKCLNFNYIYILFNYKYIF